MAQQFLDLAGVQALWAKMKAISAAGAATVTINSDATGHFSGFTLNTILHNGENEDGHIEYQLTLTDVQSASALNTRLQGYVENSTFNTLDGKVTTLIGSDTGKSVRTIANEELAAQLIPPSAQEALDTLQEIAAWIQSHPADVAAMNAVIASLGDRVDDLEAVTALPAPESDPVDGTIAAYAKDLVDHEATRATGAEARIEAMLTNDTDEGAPTDGVLKRLNTLETIIGDPGEDGDISSQIEAIQDAIDGLDWTLDVTSGSPAEGQGGFNVLTGFHVVVENGQLVTESVTTTTENIDISSIPTSVINALS